MPTDQQTNQAETDAAAAAAAAAQAASGADAAAAAAAAEAAAADAPWFTGLPDDLKSNPTLAKYKSLEDAARSMITAESQRGVPPDQLIRLPKAKDAKAWDELYGKLGRPADPKDYGITPPDGGPLDQTAFDGYLAAAHAAGLNKEQAASLVAWHQKFGTELEGKLKAEHDRLAAQNTDALKTEWGAAYETKLKGAADAAVRFGGKELAEYLDQTGLGNDPRMIKTFAAIAAATAEAGDRGLPDNKGRNASGLMTPAEAKAEIARIETDPDIKKVLLDKNHSQHAHWTQRRLDLFALAGRQAP